MSRHQQQKKHQTHKVSWRESDHIDSWKSVGKEWKGKMQRNVQTQIQLRLHLSSQCTSLILFVYIEAAKNDDVFVYIMSLTQKRELPIPWSLADWKQSVPKKIMAFISRSWCLALGCFVMEKIGRVVAFFFWGYLLLVKNMFTDLKIRRPLAVTGGGV